MLEQNSALEVFEKSVGYPLVHAVEQALHYEKSVGNPLVYTVEQAEHYEMLLLSKKE